MFSKSTDHRRRAGVLGLAGVLLFIFSFLVFGNLNPSFNFKDDFVSKLGALDEPYAFWWNLIGFGLVGVLQIGFGALYGRVLNDKLSSVLLVFFGVGLVFTAFPSGVGDSNKAFLKVHVIAICLALASWLLALSRLSYNSSNDAAVRRRANIASVLIVLSISGFSFQIWSMATAHRLVFATVLGWTAVSSLALFRELITEE